MQINIKNLGEIYAITPDFNLDFNKIKQVLIKRNIKILQYRRKNLDFNLKLDEAKKLKQLCLELGVILIINDNVELCQQIDADGVHLGKNDASFLTAKKLLPNKIIGISCYNDLELAKKYESLGVDYIAFGAIFSSKTKPNAISCNLEIITKASKILKTPIIAIGGINFNNKNKVLNSGANMIAMISGLWN